MKQIIFLLGALCLLVFTTSPLKADQLDAYPQSPTNPQPEPRYEPVPPVQPQAEPPPQYEEPRHRRRGFWVRREYPDDSWSDLRFIIKTYYDFSGTGYSNNASISNGSFSNGGGLSVAMNSAPGFGAEVFMAPPFGWGFDAGLEYDLTRNINILNNPNVSVFYNSSVPTLQFTTIYANAIFRWLNFYIPLGLNYTIPSFSGGSNNGLITNSSFSGTIGYQFGVGYLLGDHFAFELEDRTIQFSGTSTSSNTSLSWGTVSLSGVHLSVKFAF